MELCSERLRKMSREYREQEAGSRKGESLARATTRRPPLTAADLRLTETSIEGTGLPESLPQWGRWIAQRAG